MSPKKEPLGDIIFYNIFTALMLMNMLPSFLFEKRKFCRSYCLRPRLQDALSPQRLQV